MPLDTSKLTPEFFTSFGAGLLSGGTWNEQLSNAATNATTTMAAQREKATLEGVKNKTAELLQVEAPDLAVAVRTGALTATDAYRQHLERKAKAEEAKRPDYSFMNVDGRIVRTDKNSGTFNEVADYSRPKLPAIAEEYNWMKTQGFDGSAQEYQAWKANQSKSGLMVESDGQGGFRMVQGDVSKLPPKLTEAQSKDINFLGRAKKAEDALSTVENELTSFAQKRVTGLPYDIGNYLQTPEYQKAQQAGREILAVILRKDTGAAVTPQEFEMYSKIYLPQPGDDAETIAAKKASRATAIKGIQDGLGPAAPKDAATPDGVISAEDYFKGP